MRFVLDYDRDTGTLYVDSGIESDDVEAFLDDAEFIVAQDATGRTLSVTVPFVDTVWSRDIGGLMRLLSRYVAVDRNAIERAIH